ncbi:MAG: hypothetical protein ACI37Z_08555 [Candidatus Gastranaerophilaceae bacterium]
MKKFFAILVISMLGMPAFSAQNFTLKATPTMPARTNTTANTTNSINNFSDAVGFGIRNTIGYTGAIGMASGVAGRSKNQSVSRSVDPYFIEVDGNKYIFIKDNHDNVLDSNDILGINDTKENVFASLRPLDKNGDNRLSGDELASAGIRIVRLNSNGKLIYNDKSKDFKNSDVVFIYMSGLRKSYQNDKNIGEFGLFDVVVKRPDNTKKIVTGIVTFENEKQIKKYLPNS